MRKLAVWIFAGFAALWPASAGATVQVVDVDGTRYAVSVVPVDGMSASGGTALLSTIQRTNGTTEMTPIPPTRDVRHDQDPQLLLAPGAGGPVLIWSRSDGYYSQIAYSRFSGGSWSDFNLMTSGPRDHIRPRTGVDSAGRGYLVWVEPAAAGSVYYATFDPATGNLMMSPRDLMRELVRASPPEWLTPDRAPRRVGSPTVPGPAPEGGNDAPAVPPTTKHSQPPDGELSLTPSCSKAMAAVVNQQAMAIGLLEGGIVLRYYRSVIPVGAPIEYVPLFLQSLLNQNCP